MACNVGKDLVTGDVLAVPGDIAGGLVAPVVEAVQEGFAESISHWVADGATYFLEKVGGLVDATTAPKLDADWFKEHYRAMAALAAVLLIPLIFMSVIGAVIHQDGGRLLRMVFGNLPMAVMLTAAGVALVTVGLTITDEMSVAVSQGASGNAGEFLAKAGAALRVLPAQQRLAGRRLAITRWPPGTSRTAPPPRAGPPWGEQLVGPSRLSPPERLAREWPAGRLRRGGQATAPGGLPHLGSSNGNGSSSSNENGSGT